MWQPHGNRLSKTQFLTLINIKEKPRTYQRITQRRKKKEKKNRNKERRAQAVARDLGNARPRFFSPRSPPYNRFVQQGSESLDSFSLRSDCCVLDFLIFFFFGCISACTRGLRL